MPSGVRIPFRQDANLRSPEGAPQFAERFLGSHASIIEFRRPRAPVSEGAAYGLYRDAAILSHLREGTTGP